jgi:hypothetical protein
MRRILVDHARHRNRLKHGGDLARITLTDLNARSLSIDRDQDVLTVAEVLDRLEHLDPRQAKIVELRFFGGSPWMRWRRHSESRGELLRTNGG